MTDNFARHTVGVIDLGTAYVDFTDSGREVHHTTQPHPAVLLDLDENENLVGIEVIAVPGVPRITFLEHVPWREDARSAAARLVRQLHPTDERGFCSTCVGAYDPYDGEYARFLAPCPTVAALGPPRGDAAVKP